MKYLLACMILASCGTPEQEDVEPVPTIPAIVVPTVAPVVTPIPRVTAPAVPTVAPVVSAAEMYASAHSTWHACYNRAIGACGRPSATYSPAYERCKDNASLGCGNEPQLTDYE